MYRHTNIHLAAALLVAACSAGGGRDLGGFGAGGAGGSSATGGATSTGTGGSPLIIGGTGATSSTGGGAPTDGDAAVTPDGPIYIDECVPANPAGLDATATQKLMAGSGSAGSLRILNPYDGTVFPRGLVAPLLMWDGANADAVYVHITASQFEYKGCFAPSGTNQLQLPQTVWDAVTAATRGKSDPFTLELTVSSGGTATGPVSQTFVVAQATLKGSIYYNSYKSQLVKPTDFIGVFTGGQGAVVRISPGRPTEAFLGQTECNGCHSVSANGTRMVTNPNPVSTTTGGATYAIDVNTSLNPPPLVPNAMNGSFAGVHPSGSLYVSNAHPGGMGPRSGGTGSQGNLTAETYDTNTGALVTNTGIPTGAMTPMFSTGGDRLAFNDYAIGSGHGLAVMSFDVTTRTATGYQKVFETTDVTKFPGWPFFLPDDEAIVFAIGSANDFSGMATGIGIAGFPPSPLALATSDLHILDLGSGTSRILARAMGFATEADAASNKTYLPHGADDLHANYYPTVSPVAAGGYFWVFFDSYRHYGNTHAGAKVRQLWGTAVDISPDGTYAADPSHPPFYLTGQEDVEGNHRAFAALDPCHADGDSCTTGIDCCVGFCTDGKCAKPPAPEAGPVCAGTDERCGGGVSCCNASDQCLGGYCGQIFQ